MAAPAPPLALVLGTAGHIDHGKTALVRALTGIDTDRLAVEKARGITTELGFARLELDGRRLAVVDVPGHERFVRSMVAGATGLDLVCLAIAADEGVMPQTREHLDICELLGVRRGIVALTKRDLVDDAWLALATEDVRAAVAGTFLAGAPIVPVSARTGDGLPALRAAIAAAVAELPPRDATGVFRLPLDRVFTMKGFGTIVTGTILGGTIAAGDEVVALPGGRTARVRGVEVHGAAVGLAVAGQRAALNLGGIAVDELARGDLLAHPGRVAASHILDVELRYLASAAGPLPRRSKVLVHHGTAQVLATLALVDPAVPAAGLAPGSTTLAQIRTAAGTPLAALPGDRFLVRGFAATASRGATVAGGRVIRVLAPRARRGAAHAEAVARLAAAPGVARRLALELEPAAAGLPAVELAHRLGVSSARLATAADTLAAGGELLATGGHYVHARAVAALEARIIEAIIEALGGDGSARETVRAALPAALPARVFDAIVDGLARAGRLAADGDRLRRAHAPARPALAPVDARLLDQLRAWGLEPPRPKDLPPDDRAALERLIAAKLAVRVKPDLVVHAAAIAELRARLLAFLDAHGTITAQQWKDLTGASRKFTIPLAEYFDAEKVTLRVGDLRRRR